MQEGCIVPVPVAEEHDDEISEAEETAGSEDENGKIEEDAHEEMLLELVTVWLPEELLPRGEVL